MTDRNLGQVRTAIQFSDALSQCVIKTHSEMRRLENAIRAQFKALVNQSEVKQDAIAAAIGRSQSTLSQYLSGSRGARATLDDLNALAMYFGRTLAQMLSEAGNDKPALLTSEQKLLALVRAVKAIDEPYFQAFEKAMKGRVRPRPRRGAGQK